MQESRNSMAKSGKKKKKTQTAKIIVSENNISNLLDDMVVVESENLVNINLTLNLTNPSVPTLEIVKIVSERLPWFEDEKKESVQLEIQSTLQKSFDRNPIDFINFFDKIENRISQDFNISTGCTIRFKFDVLINDLSNIADKIFSNIPDGHIMPAETQIYENSAKIVQSHIEIITSRCENDNIVIEFASAVACVIEKVELRGGDKAQDDHEEKYPYNHIQEYHNVLLPPKRLFSVKFPMLTPDEQRQFQMSKNKNFSLRISFSGDNEITKTLDNLSLDDDKSRRMARQVVLFMDMGSTNTKYIVYDQERKTSSKYGPFQTVDICREFAVNYNKQTLAGMGPDNFAAWLTNAVKCIDKNFIQKGWAITQIYWAFPRFQETVHSDFYDSISQQVSNRIKAIKISGGLKLIPEDLALQGMFEGVLQKLSLLGDGEHKKIADENQRRQQEHDRKVREYKNKWFLARWFSHNPENDSIPKVGLKDYYKQCLELGCQDGLKNFILLDAGGFTLDVYAKMNDQIVLAQSFKAGGNQITAQLLDKMRSVPNYENSIISDAEQQKIKIANGQNSIFSKDLPQLTSDCYSKAIDDIISVLKQKTHQGHGFVIICSGLAFNNPFLIKLIQEKIEKAKMIMTTQVQDTRKMYRFIGENVRELTQYDSDLFSNFLNIAKRTGNIVPDGSFDIGGGIFTKFGYCYVEDK